MTERPQLIAIDHDDYHAEAKRPMPATLRLPRVRGADGFRRARAHSPHVGRPP